ncbi:MAG: dipicolinate synthase subunit B [Oscillospiraceae bacterium]|nr:dipicolinate synthase subunit B [Oscillospiraceae bacterium]
MADLNGLKIGFAMTGSFCTFEKAFAQMEKLVEAGADVIPIMSQNSISVDSRFGLGAEHLKKAEEICNKQAVISINGAEPIGPKHMTDIMLIAPCTGNTLAKLANSITDGPVTMAVKSHLRNSNPVIVNISTNDALAGSLKNIGLLMNMKNYYFVPFCQDNSSVKPTSLISDFTLIQDTIEAALKSKQLQPVIAVSG